MKVLSYLLALFMAGCVLWVPVSGKYVSADDAFEVDLPAGWRRAYSTRNGLTITRDGLSLQVMRVVREPFDTDLPYTKRKLEKEMFPQEIAEVIIDNLRSNQNTSNFQLHTNQPARVGGYPGFKLTFSYQTKENLKKEGVYYGVLVDQWYYRLVLEAPSRHYFPRDQAVLERVQESFKITL
jgi:hypothetical protein